MMVIVSCQVHRSSWPRELARGLEGKSDATKVNNDCSIGLLNCTLGDWVSGTGTVHGESRRFPHFIFFVDISRLDSKMKCAMLDDSRLKGRWIEKLFRAYNR